MHYLTWPKHLCEVNLLGGLTLIRESTFLLYIVQGSLKTFGTLKGVFLTLDVTLYHLKTLEDIHLGQNPRFWVKNSQFKSFFDIF